MNGEDWRRGAEALRAQRPRHVLFLCVANSARSQMAEAIARALAPDDVVVSSAGSQPAAAVRPEAVRALREIGLDVVGQRPKGLDDVGDPPVDAVVTLCAEEVCPVWLGHAHRLHWPLPDPAAASGDDAARLDAFRAARDELRRRLAVVFGGG